MAVYRYYSKREKRQLYKVYVERDDADGKRRRRFVDTYRTKAEAQRAERDALDARDRGTDLVPERVTVAELFERWQRDRRARGRGAKTLGEDESKIQHHIVPRLGSLLVAKLRPAHLSQLYAELRESGRLKNVEKKGGLSTKTVRLIHGLLHAALAWAVRLQIVERNIADAVEPPQASRGKAKAYNVGETLRLFVEADKTPFGPLVRLAFLCAARRGELLALHWPDVDLERGRALIRVSLSEPRHGVLLLKSTKTGRERTIALNAAAVEVLRKHRAVQEAERLAGEHYQDQGFVFADPLGRPWLPSYVTDQFRKIVRRAGVRGRLHDARHTAASAMFADNVDVKTVSAVLGHAASSTTLDIYGHLIAGAQDSAVRSIEEYFADNTQQQGANSVPYERERGGTKGDDMVQKPLSRKQEDLP